MSFNAVNLLQRRCLTHVHLQRLRNFSIEHDIVVTSLEDLHVFSRKHPRYKIVLACALAKLQIVCNADAYTYFRVNTTELL